MAQFIAQTAVLVKDYDEAIDFYVNILGFDLLEDTAQPEPHIPEDGKRWVVVSPTGSTTRLLLHKLHVLETKQVSVYFCFYTPTTFGATTMITNPRAFNL